jgi:MipA family protein
MFFFMTSMVADQVRSTNRGTNTKASKLKESPLRNPDLISALKAVSPLVIAALIPLQSQAQTGELLPLWEVGTAAFGVSQPVYPGAAARVNRGLALPYVIYRGEYLRADRGGAGIRALKTPEFEVDVGFSGAFGSRSNDIPARQGMPDLGTMVELGPRLKWNLGGNRGMSPEKGSWRADFPLRGVFDLNHQFAHKGMVFEPELTFERKAVGRWRYSTSLGAVWGDKRLADTIYGVAPGYATPDRAAYSAQSGLIATRLSASFSRNLSPELSLSGFARVDSLAGAANAASPLVQRRSGTLVGIGLTYTFARSAESAAN